jgi:general L-amino acid transport system substrate-binding protein
MQRLLGLALVLAAIFGAVSSASAGTILDEIEARGKLRCGIYDNLPGLATLDDKGQWQGFDVD